VTPGNKRIDAYIVALAEVLNYAFLWKCIISIGVDLDFANGSQRPVLFYPMRSNNVLMMQYLLDSGISTTQEDREGHNALYEAASFNRLEIMHVLLKRETEVNHKDIYGSTPLHYAIQSSKIEQVQFRAIS
jgi:ankyrin repeat protein